MVAGQQVLAVVPARGGSKSIPKKNLRPFLGHPLLAYSVAAGLQSDSVGRVIVSTDDEETAEIGLKYGAEVPFLRPANLARDDSLDFELFEHLLAKLAKDEDYRPELVVQLRPTSPLRPPGLVDSAVEQMRGQSEADSLRGVVPSGQNPYKMWRLGEGNRLQPLWTDGPEEAHNQPRQSLPPTYWQTGHIDVVRPATIADQRSMSGSHILGLLIDPKYSVDIDGERDWRRAEALARAAAFPFVRPGGGRSFPEQIALVVLDFDGVMTDDRVWVDADGRELVAAHRGDGWGIARLLERGIDVIVLSTERNPVVAARCRKLGIEAVQGIEDKPPALEKIARDRGLELSAVLYVGNDANDVDCFDRVGWAVVPADAHVSARMAADQILEHKGGRGSVREVCDMLLARRMEAGKTR